MSAASPAALRLPLRVIAQHPRAKRWPWAAPGARYWVFPAFFALVLVGLSLTLWMIFSHDDRRDITSARDLFQKQFSLRFADHLAEQRRRVEQFAAQCADVKQFNAQSPVILDRSGIDRLLWVDNLGVVQGACGSAPDMIGQSLLPESPEMQAINLAHEHAQSAAGSVLGDGKSLHVILAVRRFEGSTETGQVLASIDLSAMVASLLDASYSAMFDLRLTELSPTAPDAGYDLTPQHNSPSIQKFAFDPGVLIEFCGQSWRVATLPSVAFLAQQTQSSHRWMLMVWLCTLLLTLASVGYARYQRFAETRHLRRQLDALESLTAISAAVSNQGTTADTIGRLPEGVRLLLGMSVATVGILDNLGRTLTIVASDGIEPPLTGQQFFLSDLASARQCVKTASLIAIHDTHTSELNLNLSIVDQYRLRSILQIPMIVHDRIIGVMFLGDHRVRHFSREECRLAWLWGAQVAVMLMSSELYQQSNRALQSHQKLLAQRDALYSVNAAIYRPGTVEEILSRIAELAPGPLEVDAAMVYLVADNDPATLVAAAVTPPFVPMVTGYRVALAGSKSEIVLAHRQTVVVEDGPSDPTLNPYLRKLLPCGSLIFVPLLRSDRRPLGVIVLMRKATGPFRKDQLDLAELFSARAAAAIEMGRLYQQTRRDADAKAMLLRELNHRVKNNMASIVSLLSINEPELSPLAKQWLDRAIDRIRNLAQAHEVFSGGLERVTLAQLIEQTLGSLSVVRPPGVRIEVDLQARSASLRTDRAVSLAMALHELCFNAIVHGLGSGGELIIRTRFGMQNLVMVEVEDDGSGALPPRRQARDAAAQLDESFDSGLESRWPVAVNVLVSQRKGTGLGLSLVNGLITRELRGHFDLVPTIQGGTVACCEFPLYPDELPGNGL